MEIKSYDELIMAIYENKGILEKIYLRLDELSINPFSKDRFERRQLKQELLGIEEKIDSYKRIIDKATTFKRYQLLPFFCEYLTLTEQEDFVVTKLMDVEETEEDNYTSGLTYFAVGTALKNPVLSTYGLINMTDSGETSTEYTNYYFVSNKKVAEALLLTHEDDIEETLNEIEEPKCFYVTKQQIHLARGTRLKKKYLVYPQLQDVFKRLIDLYLKNPEMSVEEKFDQIIQETKGRKFINKY